MTKIIRKLFLAQNCLKRKMSQLLDNPKNDKNREKLFLAPKKMTKNQE